MGSTVVCAIDIDDDGSRRPLGVGAELAERLGLQLVVAYVAPRGSFPAGAPVVDAGSVVVAPAPVLPYPYPEEAELDNVRDEARRRVERLVAQSGLDDAQVEVAVQATVADGLRQIAADRDAHLLVVGSHGHGMVRAALLGSTSHALAGNAPCPVVVVPASD